MSKIASEDLKLRKTLGEERGGESEGGWVVVDKTTDLPVFPAFGCAGDWNKMAKFVIKGIPLISLFLHYSSTLSDMNKIEKMEVRIRKDASKGKSVNEERIFQKSLYREFRIHCHFFLFYF